MSCDRWKDLGGFHYLSCTSLSAVSIVMRQRSERTHLSQSRIIKVVFLLSLCPEWKTPHAPFSRVGEPIGRCEFYKSLFSKSNEFSICVEAKVRS